MTAKRGARLQVYIDRLSVGGRGVARHEGLVIFIADTAPDEEVEVELTLVKKNFAEARLIRVVMPSPWRVKPPCPVAGICGGCTWQHVRYDEQLRQKKSLVSEALRKFANVEIAVADVVASPNEFRYRNRIQLHHQPQMPKARMGFFKRGSHEIVDIDDCPITETPVADLIPALKLDLARAKPGRLELLISSDGRVGTRRGSDRDIEESPHEDSAGPAFSQVNSAQNRQLVDFVVAQVERILKQAPTPLKAIYDLYAGSGNFTFPIAQIASGLPVTAVELSAQSVEQAREQLASVKLPIRFLNQDVASFLNHETLPPNSLLLLDPPRVGCDAEVMRRILQQAPAHILYVSCHPVTLARDLRPLIEAGYRMQQVQPFDMFPQTDHVETVIELLRGIELTPS